MSVSRCPTFWQFLANTLLSPRARLPSPYSAYITLWLCPKVHPCNIVVLTPNSFHYAIYVIPFNVVHKLTHSSFGQFRSSAVQLRPKPNVKWDVITVTETEPKLHLRSVSAPKPKLKPNFGRSLLFLMFYVFL